MNWMSEWLIDPIFNQDIYRQLLAVLVSFQIIIS